jgi:hypothetical protein
VRDADLLAQLPAAARDAFARAIALRDVAPGDSMAAANAAVGAAGVPQCPPSPVIHALPSTFDGVQRAALEYSAIHDLVLWPYPCPSVAKTRRRWLGVDPAGVLESRLVEIEHDGTRTTEPLWRALQLAGAWQRQAAILDSLSLEDALRALDELYGDGSGYRVKADPFFAQGSLRLFRELRGEGREWAIERADALAADPAAAQRAGVRPYVFLALVRASVPIEPRWDALFPNLMGATKEFLIECASAIPEGRRASAVGPHLRSTPWAPDLVSAFPTEAMARALLDGVEPRSDRWTHLIEKLREVGLGHPEIGALVERIVATTPEPIELFVTRTLAPKRASQLTDVEREQVRALGRGHDGNDLDADARLADDASETSFRALLELRTIARADGAPLYEAVIYLGGDAGVVFRAGTTDEVAWLSQGGVVLSHGDDGLRLALQNVLGPRASRLPRRKPVPQKSAREEPARRKPASRSKKPPR